MGRMAVKTLTNSDLTLFEWHFRNRNAGNQKSINLNADIFIDVLYPFLPNTDVGRAGRIPIDLYLYGPGEAPAWNLQRKIIKGATYKNWRLDGEYISAPEAEPDRFNILQAGDFAVFDFEGELFPFQARVVFVAGKDPADTQLHTALNDFGIGRMRAIELAELTMVVRGSGITESHGINELLLDSAIEDAARGGWEGTERLLKRRITRRLTRAELARARQRAEDVGQLGEELIDGYFNECVRRGELESYEWISRENAISPYDFLAQDRKVEVKSTSRSFGQTIHISIAELIEMANCDEPFDLYRVYCLEGRKARLRIAEDAKAIAEAILEPLKELPEGVQLDGVSVRPEQIEFGREIEIDLSEVADEADD